MGKWLAIGGVLVLALLLFLLREMSTTEAKPAPAKTAPVAEASPSASTLASAAPAKARAAAAVVAAAATPPAAEVKPAQAGKLDPRTDEFFYRFDEKVPKVLTRNAARCYEGHHGQLRRNQKLSLTYKVKVVNGEVTVRDVRIKESTLGDGALETCFIQEVQRSTWRDDELPDV